MQITFIENSLDFTSTSLDLKALDYKQKNLINFALEVPRTDPENKSSHRPNVGTLIHIA